MRRGSVVVIGVLLSALVSGCGGSAPQAAAPANPGGVVIKEVGDTDPVFKGFKGAVLQRPYVMPRTRFTDSSGKPFTLVSDTRKPVTLVFFGYTHCPDECPAVLAAVAAALAKLPPRDRARIQLVFVSTDPARDTPARLKTYLARFDPAFVGLNADIATVITLGKKMGVAVERGQKLPSGGYDVAHTTQVIGFEADHRARLVWVADTPVGDLAHDFAELVKQHSSHTDRSPTPR